MNKNMGSTDRKLRAFLVAPVLVVVGVVVGLAGSIGLAVVLFALAAVMVATSAVATCPLYMPFGLSTRRGGDTTTPAAWGTASR